MIDFSTSAVYNATYVGLASTLLQSLFSKRFYFAENPKSSMALAAKSRSQIFVSALQPREMGGLTGAIN